MRAGEDLTMYRFVTWDTAGDVTFVDSGVAPGICEATVDDDDAVPVAILGPTFLEVNGNSVNIGIGDGLKPTTDGVGVKAATDKDIISAMALDVATADGIQIPVLKLFCTLSTT